MQQTKNFLLIISVLCILSACSSLSMKEKTTHELKTSTKNTNTPPKSFNISGAIAVNSNGKGWNANLNWKQINSEQYTIRLSGPIGSKTIVINKDNSGVTYQENGQIIKAHSAEELLKKKAKVSLPIYNLYYWIRGIPAPSAIQLTERGTNNQLSLLKQDGFTINYNEYMTTNSGAVLPRKIRITGKNITIKLVIRNWS